MDWIKIKVSHALFEYPEFKKNIRLMGAWCLTMAITAKLEKMPNNEQLLAHIHGSTLRSLKDVLKLHGSSLEDVLKKVLEDVEYTQDLRLKHKTKMAEWREKKKDVTGNVTVAGDDHVTSKDKIREDKIIEDKKEGKDTFLVSLWISKNKAYLQSSPKLRSHAEAQIAAAGRKGYPKDEIERIIIGSAGKCVPPWELFPQKKESPHPRAPYHKPLAAKKEAGVPMPKEVRELMDGIGKKML